MPLISLCIQTRTNNQALETERRNHEQMMQAGDVYSGVSRTIFGAMGIEARHYLPVSERDVSTMSLGLHDRTDESAA